MDRQSNKEFETSLLLPMVFDLKCLKHLDIHQTIVKIREWDINFFEKSQ